MTLSVSYSTPSPTELSSTIVPLSTVQPLTSATSSASAAVQSAEADSSCLEACDHSGNLNDMNLAIIKLGTILVLA